MKQSLLSPKQQEFVSHPAPFKVAVCSRRAGKTMALATLLLHTAYTQPEVVCLYATVRRTAAKKVVWGILKKLNLRYQLGGTPNESELSIAFRNGSIVYVSGAKDASEIEHIRGLALKLAVIDEAQNFRSYIKQLIDDVIAPALLDAGDGQLILCGTPSPVPVGYFYESTRSNAYTQFNWTFFDNPFLPGLKKGFTHRAMLDRELSRRGCLETDPSIQREYFGRWVHDTDSLLLHYDATKCHYIDLPGNGRYQHILGVDLGYEDADALAVLAWNDRGPDIYLREELVVAKQGITELVGQIKMLQRKYDIGKIVVDAGGLGKKITEEIRMRHGINMEAADKTHKLGAYQFLNDAMRAGRFKAKSDSRFAQDSYLLEIDRDKTTPERLVVSDRFHSDIVDAALYAFRASPFYAYTPPIVLPTPGTTAYDTHVEAELFENRMMQLKREKELRDGNPTLEWGLDAAGTAPWNKWED